jgi:DinB superfamily
MRADDLRRVILRDAASLRDELMAYADERQIWAVPPGTRNPAGTLVLHLAGNLQHFIGAGLGKTGYVRDRDAEFSRRDVPRSELVAEADRALAAARAGLAALGDGDLDRVYPFEVGGRTWPTGLLLLHMATHLSYHLGQIDYHRRIVTGETGAVTALSLTALAEEG